MLNIISKLPLTTSNKPSLLFVHGAWHGAWCWAEHYLPYFADQGFASYALDLRGHGQSPHSKSLRFIGMGDYVEDVAKVVDEINGDVIVIGHSMGGYIVQKYLKTEHHALGGVLLSTVPWYGALKDSLYFLQHMPLKFLKMMLTLSVFPLVEDPVKAAKLLFADNASQQDLQKYTALLQDESYLAFMQMALPSWGHISAPLLVIGGEKDKLLSPISQQSTAKRYAAECHIITDAPHNQMLDDRWADSAKLIKNWLDKHFS